MPALNPNRGTTKHRTKPCRDTRAALDRARQGHLKAFHAAIAGGTPADELAADFAGFSNASRQLIALGRGQEAEALLLKPLEALS